MRAFEQLFGLGRGGNSNNSNARGIAREGMLKLRFDWYIKSNCCVTKTVHGLNWMGGTECHRMWFSTKTQNIWESITLVTSTYKTHGKTTIYNGIYLVPPYVSMCPPDVCHQKLLEIVQREEMKVKWILSANVEFLNSEKGPRDRYKLPGARHFARQNSARTDKTWYLIWEADDRCLLISAASSSRKVSGDPRERENDWLPC